MAEKTLDQIDKNIEKDLKHDFGTLEKISFISDLLAKQTEIRNMLDVRANIVIGFNSALVVVIAVYFKDNILINPLLWLLMAILLISWFLAIIALKPPHYQSHKGQAESLFYHNYINSMDMEEYRKDVRKALDNEGLIFDAYITEIYNITRYSNVPRKMYLYLSLRVLIYGVAIVLLIYSITSFINYYSKLF